MDNRIGYVVITYNQASHRPDLEDGVLYDDLNLAREARDDLRDATAEVGRRERHVVAQIVDLPQPLTGHKRIVLVVADQIAPALTAVLTEEDAERVIAFIRARRVA